MEGLIFGFIDNFVVLLGAFAGMDIEGWLSARLERKANPVLGAVIGATIANTVSDCLGCALDPSMQHMIVGVTLGCLIPVCMIPIAARIQSWVKSRHTVDAEPTSTIDEPEPTIDTTPAGDPDGPSPYHPTKMWIREWMATLDRIMLNDAGLHFYDARDDGWWRDLYHAGLSPQQAAEKFTTGIRAGDRFDNDVDVVLVKGFGFHCVEFTYIYNETGIESWTHSVPLYQFNSWNLAKI